MHAPRFRHWNGIMERGTAAILLMIICFSAVKIVTRAEPVADCVVRPGLSTYYYIVDSEDRCIYYVCLAYINAFSPYAFQCPNIVATVLDYPTNMYPCTARDWSCPKNALSTEKVSYKGFDLEAALNPLKPCDPNPCQSVCKVTADNKNYTCECPEGKIGSDCEHDNPCTMNPCMNDGVCAHNLTDVVGSTKNLTVAYNCTCTADITGNTCEILPCINVTMPTEYTNKTSPFEKKVAVGEGPIRINLTIHNNCESSYNVSWYATEINGALSDHLLVGPSATATHLEFTEERIFTLQSTTKYYYLAKIDGWETVSAGAYVKFIVSNLVPTLAGDAVAGSSIITKTIGETINLDASGSKDPDDPENTRGALTFSWSCNTNNHYSAKPTSAFSNISCPENIRWLTDSNKNNISIGTQNLTPGTYTFRLRIMKGATRVAFKDVILTCECREGKIGSHCEHDNPCTTNPCLNDGVCTHNLTDVVGSTQDLTVAYNCTCMADITGDMCEVLPCINVTMPTEYTNKNSPFEKKVAVGEGSIRINLTIHNNCESSYNVSWYATEINGALSDHLLVGPSATATHLEFTEEEIFTHQSTAKYYYLAKIDGWETVNAGAYVKYIVSNLVPTLAGDAVAGSSIITKTIGETINLDASGSEDPDDPENTRGALTFSWSCNTNNHYSAKPTSAFSNISCPENIRWLTDSNKNNISIGTQNLITGTYTFRLRIMKGATREAFKDFVVILTLPTPVMNIACHSNCVEGKRPVSLRMVLVLECDVCKSCPEATYNWVAKKSYRRRTKTLRISDIATIGDGSLSIGIEPWVLEAPKEYYIYAMFTCSTSSDRTTVKYEFETAEAIIPDGGNCSITPDAGSPLSTNFTVNCEYWSSPSLPLYYSMKSSGAVFYSGNSSSSIPFMLSAGDKDNDYSVDVEISIIDTTGATAFYKVSAMVGKPEVTIPPVTVGANLTAESQVSVTDGKPEVTRPPVTDEAIITTSRVTVPEIITTPPSTPKAVVTEPPTLEEAVAELNLTDRKGAALALTSLAETLNEQTLSTNNTDNKENVVSSRTAVRAKMVAKIMQMSSKVESVDEIVMISSAVTSTTDTKEEVNENAMVEAASALTNLANTAVGLLANEPEKAIPVTKALLPAVWNVQSCTKPKTEIPANIVDDQPIPLDPVELEKKREQEENNPLTPAERAYRKRKLDISIMRERTRSLRAAKSLASVSDGMTGIVSSTLKNGALPVVVSSEKASMSIKKSALSELANSSITSDYGEIQMPDFPGGNGSASIDTKASTFKSNPFLWGSNSESITSPVTTLDIRNEDGTAMELNDEVSVSIKATTTIPPTQVNLNSSINSQTGMVYHKVNVTVQGAAIALDLRPPQSADAIEVYLNDVVQPTATRFLHKMDVNLTDRPVGSATVPVTFGPAFVRTTGIYFIGVKPIVLEVDQSGRRTKRSVSATNTSDTYSVAIGTTACRVWDSDLNDWVMGGEIDTEKSTLQSTTCKVKITPTKSSFGLSFISPPNMIDFSTVWAKFADLQNNAAVFSIIIIFIALYILFLIWAIREDRKDKVKWAVQQLDDNLSIHTYEYIITVATGLKTSAGTRSNVWFVLDGAAGNTGTRNLEGKRRMDFPMGSCRTFIMRTSESLGRLHRLRLWHDDSGKGSSASWYVETFTVVDVLRDEVSTFLCQSWLASDRDERLTERMFRPATKAETSRFSFLYNRSKFSSITDSYLWLSIILRPIRSRFTRAQRLSCCIATLFLSMVTSAMFYGTEDNVERPGVIKLGPFIFSFQELWISFVSICITLPPMALIIEIFRKAKEKTNSSYSTVFPHEADIKTEPDERNLVMTLNLSGKTPPPDGSMVASRELTLSGIDCKTAVSSTASLKSYARSMSLKEALIRAGQAEDDQVRTFPWWTLIIGWVICTLAILVPAFFVILYSMDWGPEVSNAWLTAHFLSLFESIFLCDPTKVIIVALVGAFMIWKRKLKETGSLEDEEEHYEDTQDYFNKMYGQSLVAEERKRQYEREKEAKARMRELAIHTVFLLMVVMVGIGAVDPNSYHIKNNIFNTYIPSFESKVLTRGGFFYYMDKYFIPNYFATADMNGQELPWRLRGFTTDFTAYRVGPARLRQIRVKTEPCQFKLPDPSLACFSDYSAATEDYTSYEPDAIKNDTLQLMYETRDAWHYTPSGAINGQILRTSQGIIYQGGGYVANFDINRDISIKIIQELKDFFWLDRQTRALVIEFTTFNPNVNLFAFVTLVAEFPSSGGVVHSSNIQIIQGYALGFFTVVVYLCGIVTIVTSLVYAGLETKAAYKMGKPYWKSTKNLLSWVIILNVLTSVVTFAIRMSETTRVMNKMNEDHTAYVPFRRVAEYDEGYKASVALLNALCFLKFTILMRVYHRIENFLRSLSESISALLSFFVCFLFALFAFTLLAFLLFVSSMSDYRSLTASAFTLINAALGVFDVNEMSEAVGEVATQLFFTVYMSSMMFILVNLLVAIICDGQVAVQMNPVTEGDIDVIIEKLWPDRSSANKKEPPNDKNGASKIFM